MDRPVVVTADINKRPAASRFKTLIVIGVASTLTLVACPRQVTSMQEQDVDDSSSHLSLNREDYIMGSSERVIAYKGRQIELKQVQEDVIEARVEEKKFKIGFDRKKEKFSSSLMPYQLYDDLDKLTQDILDHHPDFNEKKQ